MQRTQPYSSLALLSLIVVLAVAAFTRISDGTGLAHFRYDQARISLMAIEMAQGDAFHWTGVDNSVGLPTSPLTVWFYAILFAIRNDPQFVTFAVAAFNVLGVGVLWWIGYRYFGFWAGLFAGLMLAANPWMTQYSRAIWEPRALVPLILIALAVGLYGYVDRKRWAQILFLPLLLIAIQFHYAAFFLLPLYPMIVWLGRADFSWRVQALSMMLGVLVILPFAYGITLNSGESSNTLATITSIIRDGVTYRSEPLDQTLELITGLGSERILRNQATTFVNEIAPRSDLLWQSALLGVLAGMIVIIWQARWRPYAAIVIFWALCIAIVQTPAWTGRGVFIHYHLAAIPAFALLIGIALQALIDALEDRPYARYGQAVIVVAMIAFYASQALWIWQLYRYSDDTFNYENGSGQTSTPMHYLLDVRDALQAYDDVIILGSNPHESNYYVWEPMLYDSAQCVRDLLILDGVIDILPAGEYAVLVAPLTPINAGYEVPERYQHDDPQVIPLRDGEDPYIIYPFEQAPTWDDPVTRVDASAFENGLRLSGYHLGDGFMQLHWQVLRADPPSSYQYFVHFMDADGERIGQRDAPFYVGQHWCADDTLITSVLADIPADTATLRVGMYTLDADGGTTTQNVINAEGQALGQWVEIPLESALE